jgi:hypothetical protein
MYRGSCLFQNLNLAESGSRTVHRVLDCQENSADKTFLYRFHPVLSAGFSEKRKIVIYGRSTGILRYVEVGPNYAENYADRTTPAYLLGEMNHASIKSSYETFGSSRPPLCLKHIRKWSDVEKLWWL